MRRAITQVLETALHAEDLEAAETFYSSLLEREPFAREEGRYVFYQLEEAMFLLFNPEATAGENHGIPSHGTRGPGHACFRIDEEETEAWRQRLAELQILLEAEYVWPNRAVSLYFRDPAGNSLELAPWRIWGSP